MTAAVCRAKDCQRKPVPNSPWCTAHFGKLVDRVLGIRS